MLNFGKRLKTIREDRGFTQPQLAEMLKTSKRNLQYYEASARYPSFETFINILDALNVSADYFLCRTDNKLSHLTQIGDIANDLADDEKRLKLKEQLINKKVVKLLTEIDISQKAIKKYLQEEQ